MVRVEVLELQTSNVRILHADDSADWRILIKTQLERHEKLRIVDGACDGVEAVHKAAQLQPDLVLLDINMPRMNGVEAARKIQQVAPRAVILFLSLESDPDVAMAALTVGGRGFVLKSEVTRDLLTAIEAALRGERFLSRELTEGGYWV